MIVASMIVDEGIHTKQLQVKFFKKSKNVFAEKRRRHRDSPKKKFSAALDGFGEVRRINFFLFDSGPGLLRALAGQACPAWIVHA
jgi:hypothetical protein